MWIGIKLIAEEDGDGGHEIKASDRLFAAVRTVIIADLVMSIDNVLGVAAAAKGSLLLLIFGLVVSVPLVIGGAQLIMRLIERLPILIVAGGGLLGFVAGELIVEDPAIVDWVARACGSGSHWARADRRRRAGRRRRAKWLQRRRGHGDRCAGPRGSSGRCKFCTPGSRGRRDRRVLSRPARHCR